MMTRTQITDAIEEDDVMMNATDPAVLDGTMMNAALNADASEDVQTHTTNRQTRDTIAMSLTVIDVTRAAVLIPRSAGVMILTKRTVPRTRDETAESDALTMVLAETTGNQGTLLVGDIMTTFNVAAGQRREISGTDDGTMVTTGPRTITVPDQTRRTKKKGQENWQPCRMMLQTWTEPGRPASALWQRRNKRRAMLTIKRGPSHPSLAVEISPTDCTTLQEMRASQIGLVAVGRDFKEMTTNVVRS